MVHTIEALRGGGGSIKIGTTGTISALMSRELESMKSASNEPSSCTTPRRMIPKTMADEASCSSTSSFKNQKGPKTIRRQKHQTGSTNQIPMHRANDVLIDGTPTRQKLIKKGPGVVEIVDLKCGDSNKTWVNPITNHLKKLSFSKLSDSIV